jgi:hypothetical protein
MGIMSNWRASVSKVDTSCYDKISTVPEATTYQPGNAPSETTSLDVRAVARRLPSSVVEHRDGRLAAVSSHEKENNNQSADDQTCDDETIGNKSLDTWSGCCEQQSMSERPYSLLRSSDSTNASASNAKASPFGVSSLSNLTLMMLAEGTRHLFICLFRPYCSAFRTIPVRTWTQQHGGPSQWAYCRESFFGTTSSNSFAYLANMRLAN